MHIKKYRNINNRFKSILIATVEGYINTCSPVSSKYVQGSLPITLSTATIRNVMSILEKDGFLRQVHKSGGRIPTDLGYRFYIDSINFNKLFDNNTIDVLERELKTISGNVDELLSATASMLSKVSSMFGVITISEYHNSILADIDLVELNKNRAMIVLAMDNGLVKSIVLNLDIEIATKHIHSITEILKEKLRGLSLIEIQNTIFKRLNDTKAIDHEIVQILINDSSKYFSIENNKLIYTSSYNVLLDQPEFKDIDNFQKILPGLEKQFLNLYMEKSFNIGNKNDLIGKENNNEIFNNCAFLTSKFESEALSGRIGLIGPKRINYINMKSILNTFKKVVQNAI